MGVGVSVDGRYAATSPRIAGIDNETKIPALRQGDLIYRDQITSWPALLFPGACREMYSMSRREDDLSHCPDC